MKRNFIMLFFIVLVLAGCDRNGIQVISDSWTGIDYDIIIEIFPRLEIMKATDTNIINIKVKEKDGTPINSELHIRFSKLFTRDMTVETSGGEYSLVYTTEASQVSESYREVITVGSNGVIRNATITIEPSEVEPANDSDQ